MVKLAIGGAIDKQKIAELIQEIGGERVKFEIMSDIEAAMAVKSGAYDYYLGACATGGGGSLAMAIALLGANNCKTISMPGKPPREEDVREAFERGKKAFGFTNEHIGAVVPMLMKYIIKE